MWRTALLAACGASAAPLSDPGVVRAVGSATWAEPALVLSVCGLAFLCILLVACSWCLPRPIPFKEFEDPLADEFGADDFIPPGEDTPSHHAAPSPPPGLLLEATTVADVYTLPRHHDQQHRDGGHTAATVNRQNISYVQELGRGWFGQVLLGDVCSQPGIGPVAVRQLEPSARLSEQTRFLHEVQPYRVVRHEHVQRCVCVCTEAVPLLALMEFCPMGDVKAFLAARAGAGEAGGAGEAERCRMARQVAAGLAHLHQQGFVHRDLALRNCLLSTDLTVKIGDYGIGPDKHPDDYVDLGVGDPVAIRWLAPELLLNLNAQPRAAPQTAPGNVWAMGVTLWELLESGARPYGSISDADVLSALARDSLPRLSRPALRSPNAEQWYEVLLFCWLDKERRPSASEVHQLLAHLQGDKQQQQQEEEEEHRELLPQAALLEAQPQQQPQKSSFDERWNALAPPPPPPQLPGLEQQPDLAGLTAYFPPSPAAAAAGVAGLGSAFPLLQPIGGRALPQGATCERPGALEASWWEPPPPPVGPVVAGAARGNPFLERLELEPGPERRAPPDPVPAVPGSTRAVTLGGSHLGESSTDPGLNGTGALWDDAASAGADGGDGAGTSGAARDPLLGLLTTDRLQDNYYYLKNTALIKESARSGGVQARAAQAGGGAEASPWGEGENAPAGLAATTGTACPPDSTTVADLHPRTGSMQPRSAASPPDSTHLSDSLLPDSARPPSTLPHSASRLGSTTVADISPLPDSTQPSSTSPPDSTTTADSLLLHSTHSPNSTSHPDSTTTADSLLLHSTHSPNSTSHPDSTTTADSLLLHSTHSPNSTSHPDSTTTADSLLLGSTHPPNSTSPPDSTTTADSLLFDSTHSPNSTSPPDSTSTADSLLLGSTHSPNSTSPPDSTTTADSLLFDSTHSPNSTSPPDSTSTADSLLLYSAHPPNSTIPPHSTTTAVSPYSTVVPRSTHPPESSHLPESSLPTESTSPPDWNLLSHSASPSHSTPPTAPTRPPDSTALLDPTLPSESVTPANITCPPISTHLPKSTAMPTTLTESTPQTNSTSPPESTLRPASSFPTASITLAESTARNNSTVPPESTPPPASSFPSASSTPAESTTPPINSTPPPPSSTPLIDPTPPSNGVRVGREFLLPSRPPPPPPATAVPHHVTQEELNTNNNNQWSSGGGGGGGGGGGALPAPSPNNDWSRLPDLSPLASPGIGDPSDEPDAAGKGEGELATVPAGVAFHQHLVVGRALLQADEAGVRKSLYRDSAYFSDLELDKHGGGGGGAETPVPANGSDGDAGNEMKRNGAGPERRRVGDDDDDVSSASSLEEVLTGGTESHDDDDDDDDFDVGSVGGGAGERDEFLSSNPFEGGFVAPAGMSERDAGLALGEADDAVTENDGTDGETPQAGRSQADTAGDATGGAEDATRHADDGGDANAGGDTVTAGRAGDAPGNGVADDGADDATAATESPANPFDIPFIDAEDSVSDEEAVGGGYGLRPGLDEDDEDEEDDDDDEEEDESWDSDEDWGPVPEVVMEEEVARSLKGLLKRPRGPARSHGKRVRFFDDVTVHLFNKAFPTSSLGGSDTCDHGKSGGANSVGGGGGGRLHVTAGGVHAGAPPSHTARPLGADRCSSDDSSEDGSGFEWDDELMPGGIRPPPVLRIPRPSRPPPPPPRHRPPDPPAAVALPLRRAPPVPLMPPAVSILSSSPPRLKLSDPAALIQSRLSGSPGLSFTHVSESDVESPPGSSEEGDGS